MRRFAWHGCIATFGLAATPALAQEAAVATVDSGDTAWMLAAAALVLFMTPGLGRFYGGMTRQKNMLATIMHSFFIIGLVSVLHRGKASVLGAASGAVAGLVAITPAAGFVGPMPALIIGLVAGVLCAGADGLLFGNPAQLGIQVVSVVATVAYSFIVTLTLLKIVDATMGLRSGEEEEVMGLDLSQHGERAYSL